MMSCRAETQTISRTEKPGQLECCTSHHSVGSPSVGAHGGHFEHILPRIGFMVQRIKLMPSNFLHLWFLLFDCFVCCQNVTCLKRVNRYGHYTGKVDDIIIARLTSVS